MCAIVAASEKRITLISAISGESDAGIPLTFGVLIATNEGRAFIGNIVPRYRNALRAIACEMCATITTTQERITVILGIASNSDALISLAFRVLIAADFL
ncbi:MAG: hypothetical protein Greene041662_201 [Candidatus Peregrinibacteria bacterium Greene0416_62]|nr:MAG: hypothetical protein Greene041662_201 [Candidatus Peregrinibacteria bacterium Greene0416_62]